MNTGLKDLLASERALFCGGALIAATILVIVGKLSADVWVTYTQWIVGIYVAGKTMTGAIERMNPQPEPIPAARVVSPPQEVQP